MKNLEKISKAFKINSMKDKKFFKEYSSYNYKTLGKIYNNAEEAKEDCIITKNKHFSWELLLNAICEYLKIEKSSNSLFKFLIESCDEGILKDMFITMINNEELDGYSILKYINFLYSKLK